MECEVHISSVSDAAAIAEIEADVFPTERLMGYREVEALLKLRDAIVIVATNEAGHIVGFVAGIKDSEGLHVISIAILEPFRRSGIGTMLLAEIERFGVSKLNCDYVYGEIRESNIASKRLFAGADYTMKAMLESYYEDPIEDAIIVGKSLTMKSKGRS